MFLKEIRELYRSFPIFTLDTVKYKLLVNAYNFLRYTEAVPEGRQNTRRSLTKHYDVFNDILLLITLLRVFCCPSGSASGICYKL